MNWRYEILILRRLSVRNFPRWIYGKAIDYFVFRVTASTNILRVHVVADGRPNNSTIFF